MGELPVTWRVSLTDKCNLRCSYCMLTEGPRLIPNPDLLTDDEVIRLVRIGVSTLEDQRYSVDRRRTALTSRASSLVRQMISIPGSPEVSLTTNGIGLSQLAQPLASAGLSRINVSLDTLQADRFVELAKRDRLADVLDGLAAASAAGLTPIKVNAVPCGASTTMKRLTSCDSAETRLPVALHRTDAP